MLRMMFAALALLVVSLAGQAMAQDKIGILMLHGKNPGGPQDPNFNQLKSKFDHEGMLSALPDMPWSARRYIDGGWDKAMDEIAGHLAKLKQSGATRLFLVGHSIGAAASLSYAAQRGGVDGIVMLAPGHAPYYYYTRAQQGPNVAVKASIDEARALVAAGQGDTRKDFMDNNQGRALAVRITAKEYLSYFDPDGMADMGVAAAKMPATIPVLEVVGDQDPLTTVARAYIFEKLPANPKSEYLAVTGTHLNTPVVARDQLATWIKAVAAQ